MEVLFMAVRRCMGAQNWRSDWGFRPTGEAGGRTLTEPHLIRSSPAYHDYLVVVNGEEIAQKQ